MFLTDVILTLVALNVLVLAHEAGHFWMARRAGVKVYEFSIGFGPRLFGWKKNGIEYSVRSIFVGGFVRMAGLDEVVEGKPGGEAPEEDEAGLFGNKSFWTRVGIIFAGPFANYVVAFLCFTLASMIFGVPSAVSDQARIGFVFPKSPAYIAGLTAGDRVLAIEGQKVQTWDEMAAAIRKNPDQPLAFRVQRDGRTLNLTVTPRRVLGAEKPTGEIGVTPDTINERVGFFESIKLGAWRTYYLNVATVQGIYGMIAGKMRPDMLEGPIGLIGDVGQTRRKGQGTFLSLVGAISGSFGFFNLIPIPLPILDGGWISLFIIEKLRRRPFTSKQRAAAQMVGLALILALFVFVTWGDLYSLIRRYF